MGIEILKGGEIDAMRAAGAIAKATLEAVEHNLGSFKTTFDIARFVEEDTRKRGGRPSQLGYQGFPEVCCTSRNEVVCHGIPSRKTTLSAGDIVNVDVTTEYEGFHGDTSATFFVGTPSEKTRRLVDAAKRARDLGILALGPGKRLGEVGQAISAFARERGYSVVEDLGGHGIGRRMHQEPHVHHHAVRGGVRLKPGMALTVEPMLNEGNSEVLTLADGWTIVTVDGRLSAQFEHTVLITETGFEVLT